MMKRISLILVIALVALASQAQLLWKVSGNGLERPSYILGTYHLAPASMLDEIPGMDQAFEGCDVVVGELKKEDMMNPNGLMGLASMMMAPADSTLDKLYTPEQYKVIEQVFNKYCGTMGLSLGMMSRLKPEAINLLITLMRVGSMEMSNTDLIDIGAQERGSQLGRATMGFETLEEQAKLMFSDPIADQAKSLLKACEEDDVQDEQAQALKDAYMSQDMNRMEALFTEAAEDGWDEDKMDSMVTRRNRNWVGKLVTMMPEQACLVCVGAAHLFGDQGLLQLLRNEGYTVEPMK